MTTKWASVDRSTFMDLYRDRLMEENPQESLDEIYDLADSNEITSLTFGSSSYDFYPNRILDATANAVFLHGYCGMFAHCFNEKNNLDSFLLISDREKQDWSGHIMSVLPDGRLVDVRGVLSKEQVERHYPSARYSSEFVTEADLWERGILSLESYSHPSLWLEPFERAYVNSVVDTVQSNISI